MTSSINQNNISTSHSNNLNRIFKVALKALAIISTITITSIGIAALLIILTVNNFLVAALISLIVMSFIGLSIGTALFCYYSLHSDLLVLQGEYDAIIKHQNK